jgi:hypothetical protein
MALHPRRATSRFVVETVNQFWSKQMAKNYYVIDGEGNTLYHGREKDDCPQAFATFGAAEKRAREAAEAEPGIEFRVMNTEAIVYCPVQPAKTRRL